MLSITLQHSSVQAIIKPQSAPCSNITPHEFIDADARSSPESESAGLGELSLLAASAVEGSGRWLGQRGAEAVAVSASHASACPTAP